MITLVYDFADDFFQYKVVPTYWNDAINLVTSDFQDRIGFKFLADFYLEDPVTTIPTPISYVGTIKNQPFNGFGQIQLNSFTKNLLTYDANWLDFGAGSNPLSFRGAQICYGEEFSRRLRFSSIESQTISTCTSSNAIQLNFDQPTMLVGNDRVVITKDLSNVNPQYNGYGKVFTTGATSAIICKTYSYSQYVESGYIWEGVEFVDYHLANAGLDVAMETSNPHHFNIGDQVYLQMDNDARSSIVVTASFGDQCSYIRLYDPTYTTYQNIFTSSVNYTSTFEQFLTDIAIQINCEQPPVGGFSAWYYGTGNTIYLTAPFGTGALYNGYIPSVFRVGGTYTVATMSNVGGYDSNGKGLNPQLSNVYTVKDVLNQNEFVISKWPSVYYNNDYGSERGTLYSMNNYKEKTLLCGETFSLAHASFTINDPVMKDAGNENMSELSWYGVAYGDPYGNTKTNEVEIELNNLSNAYTVDIWNRHVIPPYDPRIDYCILETYDSTKTLIQSYTISSFFQLDQKLSLGWGPFNLNLLKSLSPTDFSPVPTGWPIDTSVGSYKIAGYDTSNNQMTNTYSFTFVNMCETAQIVWLNNLGGWEYLSFDLVTIKETVSMERNNFLKVGNYIDSKIGSWGSENYYENASITYNEQKRGTTTFNMLADSKYELTTPFFKNKDLAGLLYKDLYQSPEVYIIVPNNGPWDNSFDPEDPNQQPLILPVTILDSEIVLPQNATKIVYYRISFKLSQYKNGPHKIIGN